MKIFYINIMCIYVHKYHNYGFNTWGYGFKLTLKSKYDGYAKGFAGFTIKVVTIFHREIDSRIFVEMFSNTMCTNMALVTQLVFITFFGHCLDILFASNFLEI